MKKGLALGAILAVLASPCAAQTVAQDKAMIVDYFSNSHILGACVAIDFTYNDDAATQRLSAAQTRLTHAGMTMNAVNTMMLQARDQAVDYDFDGRMQAAIQAADANDPKGSFERMAAVYDDLQTRCDNLISKAHFAGAVTRTGYQATKGPKSYLGLNLYQAQAGDTSKYRLVGLMYSVGVSPDPDHAHEFNAYLAGAEAGDAHCADLVASNYLGAVGTPTDEIQAEKWAVIADALGSSDALPLIESKITTAQIAEGRAQAIAWLKAHGR